MAICSIAVTAFPTSWHSQETAVTRHGAISVRIPYGLCFVALCVRALSVVLKRLVVLKRFTALCPAALLTHKPGDFHAPTQALSHPLGQSWNCALRHSGGALISALCKRSAAAVITRAANDSAPGPRWQSTHNGSAGCNSHLKPLNV